MDAVRAELVSLRAEVDRLRRQALAAERLAELGTLTGGLAHEIKNPLSTVQLNLQLLGEDVDPGWPGASRVLSRLKTVQRETGRLKEILDDFLRYAGKLELDCTDLDLQQMLEDLSDFFAPQARLTKVNMRLRPGGPVVVRADQRLIKQTVLNLMLNAVQAMPDGGELLLAAQMDEGGRSGSIRITDTGTGIAAELQGRIFDAYYTTKKGGTGLGLAMARRIIREHGGDIELTSEPGKGSLFVLRRPRLVGGGGGAGGVPSGGG
jgi:two-component system, NtrC family, sensor histidine kinase HydH